VALTDSELRLLICSIPATWLNRTGARSCGPPIAITTGSRQSCVQHLPFTHRAVLPTTRDVCRARAVEKIAPSLNAFGYELVNQSSNGLTFERNVRPGWTIAVAVLVFPIGLIALTQRQMDRIVISCRVAPPR
jgi:hypothetical protein